MKRKEPEPARVPGPGADAGLPLTDTVAVDEARRQALLDELWGGESALLEACSVTRPKLDAFCASIAANYHDNPYHNWSHGVDVLLNAHRLLRACTTVFQPMEELALLVGALAHDVDHPGVSNALLAEREGDLAVTYNDQSILENRSACLVFRTMQQPECNFLEGVPKPRWRQFRKALIELVLATDIASPDRKLIVHTKWDRCCNSFDGSVATHREALLCLIVRAADVAAVVKSYDLYYAWALRLFLEMHHDADLRATPEAFVVQQNGFLTLYCRPVFGALQPYLTVSVEPTLEAIIDEWMGKSEEERAAAFAAALPESPSEVQSESDSPAAGASA